MTGTRSRSARLIATILWTLFICSGIGLIWLGCEIVRKTWAQEHSEGYSPRDRDQRHAVTENYLVASIAVVTGATLPVYWLSLAGLIRFVGA